MNCFVSKIVVKLFLETFIKLILNYNYNVIQIKERTRNNLK